MSDLSTLERSAYRVRRFALRMGEVQGQGYIGQALGWADVLAVAYRHAMKYRAEDPGWEGRDRFLLSHGHYAIAHYAALIEAGIIPESELEEYGSDDSRLPMSGMATYTPGAEISGGSLGQGLAIGVGIALALKQKKNSAFVYNSMSDGELDEGSTWEAAMGAAHHRLDNLICLVDINNQQADGPSGASAILSGDIEKPVANISVNTTRRAPAAAASAMAGATRAWVAVASSHAMSCWTAATFTVGAPSAGRRPRR